MTIQSVKECGSAQKTILETSERTKWMIDV